MLERRHGGGQGARPDLDQIGATGDKRMLTKPDHVRRELIDKFWRRAGIGEKIATGDVDLAIQGQSDRVARLCAVERALESQDFFDSS